MHWDVIVIVIVTGLQVDVGDVHHVNSKAYTMHSKRFAPGIVFHFPLSGRAAFGAVRAPINV